MAGVRPALVALCLLACACMSGPTYCKRDPITGSESSCGRTSNSPVEAAATAAAAGAAWAAVGCTVNGCSPPFRCNPDTKMCERIPCQEGGNNCPPAYSCDPDDHVCR
jgi:hypothetical protein